MARQLWELLNTTKYDFVDYRSNLINNKGEKTEVSWGVFDVCSANELNYQAEIFNGKNDALSLGVEVERYAEKYEDVGDKCIATLVVWENNEECEAPSIRFDTIVD